jgi:undecaprenyl-diphosphatase
MDLAWVIYSVILGIVEGITEFLPISSTGHLIVASSLIAPMLFKVAPTKALTDTFEIFIQLGAVVAVMVYYARDLIGQAQKIPSDKGIQRFWLNVFIAFLPAAIIGFLFRKLITTYLYSPLIVGISLILGGIVFLFVERSPREGSTHTFEQITPQQALTIGIAQVIALIPGVSRSGASILGGMFSGLDRKTATAFSFYLAIPTLGIATVYQLFSAIKDNEVAASQLPYFAIGTVIAFFVAYASIAWLLRYVSTHDFKAFGIYRIIAGAIIVVLALAGIIAR